MDFQGSAGFRLRTLRSQHGLKQQEVARALGISQGTLSHWERGDQPVPEERIGGLAEFFNVSEADLCDESSSYSVAPLHLGRWARRRLRRSPRLPPYPIRGTLEEMLALSPLANDLYHQCVATLGQPMVHAVVEHLPRDSAHELLFAFHMLAHGARLARVTLAGLGCRLLAVDGPKSRKSALLAKRVALVLERRGLTVVLVPQPWLLLPKWNRCCRPDFLTVVLTSASRRPRWLDVEIDGRFHKDNEDVDAERAAALGLPRLGYATADLRTRLNQRVLHDLTAPTVVL